jgi:hypothetical protein
MTVAAIGEHSTDGGFRAAFRFFLLGEDHTGLRATSAKALRRVPLQADATTP